MDKLLPVNDAINEGRLAEARKMLQAIRLPSGAPAKSRYEVAYYRALLAESEGDYRSAMAEAREAEEIAQRVKLERYRWMAQEMKGLILTAVGRFGDAVQLFARLRREKVALTPCEEAQVPANQAWAMLLAREAGERSGDPTPALEAALALYETCEKFTPEKRMNLLIDLALAHLQEGRLARTKELLAQARRLDPDPTLLNRLWYLDLEARIALAEGRPAEALRRFGEIEEVASAAGSPDYRLRAASGKAQSQRNLGETGAALEILREAEALLDEQSLQIPLQEGRETFMATRHAVVNLHAELLLEKGRNEEALDLVRHARSRLLRQLERSQSLASLPPDRRERWERLVVVYRERRAVLEEQARDEWRLPADQAARARAVTAAETEELKRILDEAFQLLPRERPREASLAPRPGELTLAYHPLSRGWAGFAAVGRAVLRVHAFELPPDLSDLDRLSESLLLPFQAEIEKAERIRILASGPLQGVDFHALPFGGDVLLAEHPVVYGLDLQVPPAPATGRMRHALLVADTLGDLPYALDESREVLETLRSGPQPWTTEELKGAEASAEAVRERLASADLLHYAGHGSFSGSGGWDSSLLLAEETRLTLGDLLALDDRVPAWVVLSACETGKSSIQVPIESLGLAQAFLLAGSRAVIASVRPVKDSDLPAFFPELYREWHRQPDLAVALQRAQLSWRKRYPRADWQSFRLFEP
jgi:cellulose synthase operon protein C